jgi:hypothetical protein
MERMATLFVSVAVLPLMRFSDLFSKLCTRFAYPEPQKGNHLDGNSHG